MPLNFIHIDIGTTIQVLRSINLEGFKKSDVNLLDAGFHIKVGRLSRSLM